MTSYFFQFYFSDVEFNDSGETAVKCPFPHYTKNKVPYYEQNPSASVNLTKGVFRCNRCGNAKSEVSFISEVVGCSYETAVRIRACFNNTESKYFYENNVEFPQKARDIAHGYGISDKVLDELGVRSEYDGTLSFPVYMFDKLVDVRNYNPNHDVKILSRRGSISGHIIPYDILRVTPKNKWLLICAGEKDMAVARSRGFQAVTITGGEMTLPLDKNIFKDRKIAIVYDNDDAGISGAKKLASHLKPLASSVKVVTGFHDVCENKGEDITDFFTKYKKSKTDLISYIKEAPEFTEEDMQKEIERMYPTISLHKASSPKNINRIVRTNIQVVATYDATFVAPTAIKATKYSDSSGGESNNTLKLGETREWFLTEKTAEKLLHLVDNSFTESQISVNVRELLRIPKKEFSISTSMPTKETIYKCTVTDLVESSTDEDKPMEYTAYTIGHKLESGKKYKVTHKLVPHPYKGQQLFMMIVDADTSSDSVSGFKITDTVKNNLSVVQNIPGSVDEKVDVLVEKLKGLVGYDVNKQLALAIDLHYNTVIQFDFGTFKNVRGYLDSIVITESRIGKSSTNDALREVYGLGMTTSLAAGNATIAGIIGGSNKSANGQFQTRAGLIPQNHKGQITFEELAKSNGNIMRSLTDVRSSNKVRIARVNGSIELPAFVRMLILSNTKTVNGITQPISAYPNGIAVLTDLIGAAEDIARFDMMLVLGEKGAIEVDPFWKPQDPYPEEIYKTRIRWIWSRNPEDIIIDEDVGHYIINSCNKLNRTYNSHIKVFGTEAWKKVSRLAIAIAGYVVSTDASYEKIIVKKEHVDYAVQYLISIYDNPTFKLREYVEEERSYTEISKEGIDNLQEVYIQNSSLCLQLERNSSTTKNALMAATGLEPKEFNKIMNTMIRNKFVRYGSINIIPTQRFRKGMTQIERISRVPKVGEFNV